MRLPADAGAGAEAIVRGGCPHDCPDTCAWEVVVRDGVAVKLSGAADHPFTRGGLCAKVSHFLERAYSRDRLLQPLRRVGAKGSSRFEAVAWEEALDEIGGRLSDIAERFGGEAILPYSYMGTQGIVQSASIDRRFFARVGATRLIREICGATPAAGTIATQGTTIGMLPEDLVHSRLIVLWGTNTVVTNLHLWPFIRQAQRDGARVVVIDPIRTRTAAAADTHIQPLPGSDAELALALMHVIIAEDLHDGDYIARYTNGFAQLARRAAAMDPARASALTGVAAADIVELARAYATTRPAAIRRLIGIGHHANGGKMLQAISCLPALTGAWRDRGGGMLGTTAWAAWAPLNTSAVEMPELENDGTRAVNMVQLGRALTAPLDPPIGALVVYNSNPAATAPDQQRVLQGLRRTDLFTVVIEQFMTDTARHGDYVLPATTQLEHLDLVPSWGHTYLTLNEPAVEPVGEALPNSEIFRRLARSAGFDEPYFADSDEDLVRTALDSKHPFLENIDYERLQRDGWARMNIPDDWRPFADGGFPTPSGRCELDVGDLPTREPQGDGRYPLTILTVKSAHRLLNSSYANLPRHLNAEREPKIDINPGDALERGIADGDRVAVFNDRGTLELAARVSDRVRSGVVAMPSGWWASLSPGGASANTLTCDGLGDLAGGGDFHDTRVDVCSIRAAAV